MRDICPSHSPIFAKTATAILLRISYIVGSEGRRGGDLGRWELACPRKEIESNLDSILNIASIHLTYFISVRNPFLRRYRPRQGWIPYFDLA